jgi:hypothetical protein
MSYSTSRFASDLPDGVQWLALAVVLELGLLLVYILTTGAHFTTPRYVLYPFVWINVGIWAIARTKPASASARNRRLAGVVAGGYFLLLAYFGGLIGPGSGPVTAFSIELLGIPPGWSPALLYNGSVLSLALLPYKVIGYLALAYLVYATALDASNALVGGIVGLFSCVSCSFPIIAGVVTGIVGGGSALAAFATGSTYLLSTVVFVVTVGLLYWRPTIGTFLQRSEKA